MVQVVVGRWGNSLAVRLPSDVVHASQLRDGERVDVLAENGAIVIRQVPSSNGLSEWFKGRSPAEWRAEYAAVSLDWGPDVGNEIVPD